MILISIFAPLWGPGCFKKSFFLAVRQDVLSFQQQKKPLKNVRTSYQFINENKSTLIELWVPPAEQGSFYTSSCWIFPKSNGPWVKIMHNSFCVQKKITVFTLFKCSPFTRRPPVPMEAESTGEKSFIFTIQCSPVLSNCLSAFCPILNCSPQDGRKVHRKACPFYWTSEGHLFM